MKDIEMEETNQIKQREGHLHPVLLGVYAVLIVVCVVYFFTHLSRP